jgi:hypothetical protein
MADLNFEPTCPDLQAEKDSTVEVGNVACEMSRNRFGSKLLILKISIVNDILSNLLLTQTNQLIFFQSTKFGLVF